MSFLSCPICRQPLVQAERRYCCENHHSFDCAREGYVHLLPANQKHSKSPGDDKGMAAARNRFLSGGYYAPLRQCLEELAIAYTGNTASVLDSGCGEGYYTAGIYQALKTAGKQVELAGVDLSKASLRWAAKREPEAVFAVASVYHLPVADKSIDLLVNCFSPLALEEFQRVTKPGSVFLYVVPASEHLWSLKKLLYEHPYPNQEQKIPYDGFTYIDICHVRGTASLTSQETIFDLFQMTPYYWKTPKAGAERLKQTQQLEVELAFDVHIFRRNYEQSEDTEPCRQKRRN